MNPDEKKRILIAGSIGAILGGLFVAEATNAIPKMMEKVSITMMGKMMARMGAEGCTPQDI
jgi:hypothetical protein